MPHGADRSRTGAPQCVRPRPEQSSRGPRPAAVARLPRAQAPARLLPVERRAACSARSTSCCRPRAQACSACLGSCIGGRLGSSRRPPAELIMLLSLRQSSLSLSPSLSASGLRLLISPASCIRSSCICMDDHSFLPLPSGAERTTYGREDR